MNFKKLVSFSIESIHKRVFHSFELPIQLDITNSCNLNCKHCYHSNHNNNGSINFNQWLLILEQYKSILTKLKSKPSFVLCGGEPLVSPYLYNFLDYINENHNGAPVAILTNGTLISESFINKILQYKNISFQISLDGPDSQRHDYFRGKGQFDKSIQGINLLIKNNLHVNILSVLSNLSQYWIKDFFDLGKQLKVNSVNFTRFISQGEGANNKEFSPLNPIDLRNAYQSIILQSVKTKVATSTHAPLYHLIHPQLGSYGHFSRGIVVDYKGNLKVSSRSDKIIGNILNQGLENLYLNDPLMKALRKGRIEGCHGCTHVNTCGGDRNAAYAKYGNFLAKDPGCWLENYKKVI